MKRSIGLWQWVGFGVTSLAGTLLHFLYDWTGESLLTAPFSSVNESTWEHMKLLFWPLFIFAVVQSFFFRDRKDFWCVKLRGTLLGLALIPILFYTHNGAVGKSPDWLNITIFFVSAAVVYIYETRLFNSERLMCKSGKSALAALCVIAAMFIIFTFITPRIGLFQDPVTNLYGI